MKIRKLFKFECAHVVRNCTTERCSKSIHGHSSKVELLFKSNKLDNGQMVMDFGLMKNEIKEIIDSFDHSYIVWDKEKKEYKDFIYQYSDRVITLPCSPSAESLSLIIFGLVDKLLKCTVFVNGESNITLDSVVYHETETGYAECDRQDIIDFNINDDYINQISFSKGIRKDWSDNNMWELIKNNSYIINNTKPEMQISL